MHLAKTVAMRRPTLIGPTRRRRRRRRLKQPRSNGCRLCRSLETLEAAWMFGPRRSAARVCFDKCLRVIQSTRSPKVSRAAPDVSNESRNFPSFRHQNSILVCAPESSDWLAADGGAEFDCSVGTTKPTCCSPSDCMERPLPVNAGKKPANAPPGDLSSRPFNGITHS